MNLQNKISRNAILALFLAALTLFAVSDLSAQQKNKKGKTLEDIPESVLLPPLSASSIQKQIDNFTEWVTAPYKKGFEGASVELKLKDADMQKPSAREIQAKRRAAKKAGTKYEPEKPKGRVVTLSKGDFNKQFLVIKMFISSPIMMDDVEEATGNKREWFLNLEKAALALRPSIYAMSAAKDAMNEETYNQAFEHFQKLAKKFESVVKSKPEKLSERELKSLKAKNVQRRAKAYWAAQEKSAAKKKVNSAAREKDVGK